LGDNHACSAEGKPQSKPFEERIAQKSTTAVCSKQCDATDHRREHERQEAERTNYASTGKSITSKHPCKRNAEKN
jgi:hypothetical protein